MWRRIVSRVQLLITVLGWAVMRIAVSRAHLPITVLGWAVLRGAVSRVHLLITVLGCAVLGASLLDWVLTLHATEDGYTWVAVDSSNAAAVETAEIWQLSANCARPFFVKAALQSKAKLRSHYDLAPEDVRAWRDRPSDRESLRPPADQRDLWGLVNNEQHGRLWTAAVEMEVGAKLHAQYAEWYATASRLELQANQWEQRLINVADQRVVLGEATRRNFTAYTHPDIGLLSAKSNYERYVLFLLGLGGFSSIEEQALKANCVNVTPVKRIFKNAHYFREIWRWPVDHVVVFSLGLELVLIGMLFVPITRWIGTGDVTAAKQHMRDAASRLSAKVLNFHRSKFVFDALRVSRAILLGIRSLLRALMKRYPAGDKIHFV